MALQIASGSFTSNGVAINIELGFKPKFVQLWNYTDGDAVATWCDQFADAYLSRVIDSGSNTTDLNVATSAGITPYAGDSGMGAAETGTLTLVTTTTAVAGSSTKFLSALKVGDRLWVDGVTTPKILSISSDTALVLESAPETAKSAKAFVRVNGRAQGFTLGTDAVLNESAKVIKYFAIGE